MKSNRPNTTLTVKPLAPVGANGTAGVRTSGVGAAEHTLGGLPPGPYLLTARSEGWPDISHETHVDAGYTTDVAVHFPSGSLRLDSLPTGATVRQGSVTLGRTPLMVPQLPPGECRLTVEYPTWPAVTLATTIAENTEAKEIVRLPHGKVTINTTPAGATVLLGKSVLGQTPLVLDPVPAGAKKLTLQCKDFPTLEVTFTVADLADVRIDQPMGIGFPELDPAALLRAVWSPPGADDLAPGFDSVTGVYQPKNGVVKNLHRKRLYDIWLRKIYRLAGVVKAYDGESGEIEFTEQKSEPSRYRVLAHLSAAARANQALTARLTKGTTIEVYGTLSAVEEPRWPSRVITLELTQAEALR